MVGRTPLPEGRPCGRPEAHARGLVRATETDPRVERLRLARCAGHRKQARGELHALHGDPRPEVRADISIERLELRRIVDADAELLERDPPRDLRPLAGFRP